MQQSCRRTTASRVSKVGSRTWHRTCQRSPAMDIEAPSEKPHEACLPDKATHQGRWRLNIEQIVALCTTARGSSKLRLPHCDVPAC